MASGSALQMTCLAHASPLNGKETSAIDIIDSLTKLVSESEISYCVSSGT